MYAIRSYYEIQQGFHPSLGNLRLVGGVRGIPGRVAQQVAFDHARRLRAVVAHADEGLVQLVADRYLVQPQQHLALAEAGLDLQRLAPANRLSYNFV